MENRVPNHTIGALAYHVLDVILLADVKRDLARPRGVGSLRARHDLRYAGYLQDLIVKCSWKLRVRGGLIETPGRIH